MSEAFGNGHYYFKAGRWRYRINGRPVPHAKTMRVEGRLVPIAPELHPAALLSSERAAERAGYSSASWRSLVARGAAPAPVLRLANAPAWTVGVIDAWLDHVRGGGRVEQS